MTLKGTYAVVAGVSESSHPAMPFGDQTTITFLGVGTGEPIEITLDEDQIQHLVNLLTA